MTLSEIKNKAGNLPALSVSEAVNAALAEHDTLIVTAPPGAGKSTVLPLTMLAGEGVRGKILMLEPRRLAARQIAGRMAEVAGEAVGQTVGYQVRFDRCVSARTQIEILTEGILTRRLVSDPTLEGVDVVVFDEFHERSLQTDLALALTLRVRQLLRPDLRIVIMSATMDVEAVAGALGACVIESEGRMYPVDIHYAVTDTASSEIAQSVARAIVRAHRKHEGDILAFLPGQADIQRCQQLLAGALSPTDVLPLYGCLSPQQQHRAIAPSRQGERKVVLATPVAETSVTIEGVRTVVDSGWCRTPQYDARTGLGRLETVRVSADMATQRMGRAGRVAAGTCYRLWTAATNHKMSPHRAPEIETADLTPMLLYIAAFGESEVEALPWLTPPPRENVLRARSLLIMLGALSADGGITPLGQRMSALPCHPRIASMMLGAATDTDQALACDVAAMLEERIPGHEDFGTDLTRCIAQLRSLRRSGKMGRWARIAQIAAEYRRMLRVTEDNSDPQPYAVGTLVAYAYPERIAQAQDAIGHFRLAGGAMVQLDGADVQSACSWLAVAALYGGATMGRVFLAAPLDPLSLDSRIVRGCENVSWNSHRQCVVMSQERRIGKLVVETKPLSSASADQIVDVVCGAVRKEGLTLLDWNDSVQRLQRRVAQVAVWHPELSVPDVSTSALLETTSRWLPFYLLQDGRVRSTMAELKKIDLFTVIWAMIPYELQQQIDRLAPVCVQVPTGSRIRIDYRLGAEAPVLSVRLQECFGMETTPCVDDGRVPLLMELLSPGFKPVQLTRDLSSFWQNTYFEVRKDLRRRYPKHAWPDNPLECEAVRGVRRKK